LGNEAVSAINQEIASLAGERLLALTYPWVNAQVKAAYAVS
jgi:hypothetical protein